MPRGATVPRIGSLPIAAGLFAIAVGVLVLVGWAIDNPYLKGIVPGLVTMKANTAIGIILMGAALALQAWPERRPAARVLAGAATLLGLLTVSEYLLGIDLGIEGLFPDPSPVATVAPGRPSFITATAFVLLGCAIALLHVRSTVARRASDGCLLATGALLLLPLNGHLLGAAHLMGPSTFTVGVAINTLVTLLVLSLGAAFAAPDMGLRGLLGEPGPARTLLARLLPTTVVAPLVVAYLALAGERAALYDPAVMASLIEMAVTISFAVVVVRSAASVRVAVAQRAAALEEVEGARSHLERTVEERTADLTRTNDRLSATLAEAARLAAIVESSQDAIVGVDAEGRVVSWNRGAESIFRCPRGDAVGEPLSTFLPAAVAGARDEENEAEQAPAGGTRHETQGVRRDGSPVDLSVVLFPVKDVSGRSTGLALIASDVTENRRAEARFRDLIESAPDGIVIVGAGGRIRIVNAQTERMFGYSRRDLLGKPVEMLIPHDQREVHAARRDAFSARPHARPMGAGLDLCGARKDGTRFPVEVSLSPLETSEGLLVTASVRDVTARKRVEEELRRSEERLEDAQHLARLGSWELEVETGRVSWSPELFRIYRIPPQRIDDVESAQGRVMERVHPDDRAIVMELFETARRGREAPPRTYRLRLEDGGIRWVRAQAKLVGDDGGPVRVHGTVQDVTEQRLAEDALRASLAEKEALLKEIHHRVKNNLQVTAGLLSLQSAAAPDARTEALFHESMARVKAMALVHEKLYQSTSLAAVDIAEYVDELSLDLLASYARTDQHIELRVDVAPVKVDLDTCVTCGLIVHELVSNALKHAFPEGRDGEVVVSLETRADGSARLVVRDDGVGLPPGFDASSTRTLGLQLVRGLARQLDGDFRIAPRADGRGGTSATIAFARFPPSTRQSKERTSAWKAPTS